MGYEPKYSVFKSETAVSPSVITGTLARATQWADMRGLKSYVVRRSYMAASREYLTGLVVYSKRG